MLPLIHTCMHVYTRTADTLGNAILMSINFILSIYKEVSSLRRCILALWFIYYGKSDFLVLRILSFIWSVFEQRFRCLVLTHTHNTYSHMHTHHSPPHTHTHTAHTLTPHTHTHTHPSHTDTHLSPTTTSTASAIMTSGGTTSHSLGMEDRESNAPLLEVGVACCCLLPVLVTCSRGLPPDRR